jgi:hypothetical protein
MYSVDNSSLKLRSFFLLPLPISTSAISTQLAKSGECELEPALTLQTLSLPLDIVLDIVDCLQTSDIFSLSLTVCILVPLSLSVLQIVKTQVETLAEMASPLAVLMRDAQIQLRMPQNVANAQRSAGIVLLHSEAHSSTEFLPGMAKVRFVYQGRVGCGYAPRYRYSVERNGYL